MFQYATVNTKTNVDRSPVDRPRMFVVAGVAVVLLVPLVLLVLKRSPAPTAVPPAVPAKAVPVASAPASAFEQDIELARTLLDAKKPIESLVPLDRAQRANPNSFAVYNNQCVAYGMLERRDEAVAACRRALAIDPNNQLGKNNLAWVAGIKPGAKP
jgi:Tfp pilus assembly protein PilF